jgi:hypothetical protein
MPATPNAAISILRTLHRIHRQLTDLRERLDRGPRQVRAAEANVKHLDDTLAATRAAAKGRRVAVDKKQLQLKTGEDKVKDLRHKLNAAASNREYQTLLEQIAADEMTNSVLADEILEGLDACDADHKQVAEDEAALVAARKKTEQLRAEVAAHEAPLRADLARAEAELRETEAGLPAEIRDLYQRTVRQKGEDALAAVENQYCGGCNQQVPLNLCSQIILGEPVACRTCGRLLYLPE